MTTSLVDAESVLAIEIGSIHTRALLFDVVDGQYRFIGAGRAPTTIQTPFFDISEGIHLAISNLQEITSRILLEESRLILPGKADGSGVDQVVLTYTAGQPLRVVIMGLLEDVSLESARRLAASAHTMITEAIGLNDRRPPEVQIDALLHAKPDLIILTGGTDQGASRSIAKNVDLLTFALQIIPREKRPEIIYAGNNALITPVKDVLSTYTQVHVAPNLRPEIDVENLSPAQDVLADAEFHIRSRQIGGLQSYRSILAVEPLSAPYAFARIIRFLSRINNPGKGVLGVDLGAGNLIVASAFQGNSDVSVFPMGTGTGMAQALRAMPISEISRWLPIHVPERVVEDYLWHKTLHPTLLPVTAETAAIEQAAIRQILWNGLNQHRSRYPNTPLLVEPILAAGMPLTQWSPQTSLMMLVDGLQPFGVTTFVQDAHGLTAALGIISTNNTILPVQVIESNAFVNLGTVIVPLSNARYGTTILKVKVEYDNGNQISMEVRQGSVTALPIQAGQTAKVHLQPLRPITIDPIGRDTTRSFKVIGGVCGVIVDARGRPLPLPADAARRRDMLKKWATGFGV
ncbi:MAG: glutamate mutase L [Chloroflexota bacterium]